MGHTRHDKYWQRFVLPGEKIVHTFGVSRLYVFIFWVVPSLVALILAGVMVSTNILASVLLFFVGVVFLVPAIYLRYFVHYVVTDRRVMTRAGILHKRFITVDLVSVTDLRVYESFFERLLT